MSDQTWVDQQLSLLKDEYLWVTDMLSRFKPYTEDYIFEIVRPQRKVDILTERQELLAFQINILDKLKYKKKLSEQKEEQDATA